MAMCLWRTHRTTALVGLCTAAAIVFASTSSGPIMMALFTCLGLLLWKVRQRLAVIRLAAVAAIVALQIVMNDPVYFLMARIDITGGSTGWHRAQLIRSSLEHLDEWWAVGTDYTRHWMPTGVQANAIHTDITNHFLAMGVMGGLPLMALFVATLWAAFRVVGRSVREIDRRGMPQREFLCWTLGAMLFGQAMNFWSISLFDQSVSFFYLVLASIGAVRVPVMDAAPATVVIPAPEYAIREREMAGTGTRLRAERTVPARGGERPRIAVHASTRRSSLDVGPQPVRTRR
jgi:O-antigen ligase